MLEDMAARDAVNLYLSAAESGRHNVFFVGPYGRRVNFAAQGAKYRLGIRCAWRSENGATRGGDRGGSRRRNDRRRAALEGMPNLVV
jgi:hypothetical protein